jgi:hypothetical protein
VHFSSADPVSSGENIVPSAIAFATGTCGNHAVAQTDVERADTARNHDLKERRSCAIMRSGHLGYKPS